MPPKRRLKPPEIVDRISQMSRLPLRYNQMLLHLQNEVRTNIFVHRRYPGSGFFRQIYWPAVFELNGGEALIIETECRRGGITETSGSTTPISTPLMKFDRRRFDSPPASRI